MAKIFYNEEVITLRHLFLLLLLILPTTVTAQNRVTAFVYAEVGFTSQFPEGVISTLEVTHELRLQEALFFMTMDEVVIYDSQVTVPSHQPGEKLTLVGAWNGVSVTGEIAPPWTKIKTWWHLTDEAGNSVITQPMLHLYNVHGSRSWVKMETQAVSLYAYDQPSSFLYLAAQIADEAMLSLNHSYGFTLPYRPAVVFYNSAAEGDADLSPFTHSAFGKYFGGRAYPGTGGVVVLAKINEIQQIIPHELAHLFQFQLGGQFFDAPHWWREGDAKLHEPAETLSADLSRARELAQDGHLPDLTLWNELPPDKRHLEDMMKLGMSFLYFLQEQFGEASHAGFYANWRQNRDFLGTFVITYGFTLPELEAQWKGWLLGISPGQAQVTSSSLNVRSGPGMDFEIIAQLDQHDLVTPVGRDAHGTWLIVKLGNGQVGWISQQYVIYAGLTLQLSPQLPR